MLQLRFAVRRKRMWLYLPVAGAFFVALALTNTLHGVADASGARRAADGQDASASIVTIPPGSAYRRTNFVSDVPGIAFIEDPLLVNPWGVGYSRSSPFWVVNAATSTSTVYGHGGAEDAATKFPSRPTVAIQGGLPINLVFNPSNEFSVPAGSENRPAFAIFASITGNILSSSLTANAPIPNLMADAFIVVSHPGHAYTGLALGSTGKGHFLYAADFANGRIDVFNSSYALQPAASFPFADPTIPTTAGNTYHPYNVQLIGASIYVTYAKVGTNVQVGTNAMDEEGIGNGFVRKFNLNGVRDLTFGIDNGPLNSPWGIAAAPADFGIFGNKLLVGNSGRGNPSIHAFDATTGAFAGTLQDEGGHGIVLDELRALTFGSGGNNGGRNILYFAAGLANEEHGLFGMLKPTTASATSLVEFSAADYAIGEGNHSIQITVARSGNVSDSATVNYATFDQSATGHANQKSDYEIAIGTLAFAPGETSKTFRVLLVDDKFDENDETIDLALSNPTGAGLGLGSVNRSVLTIKDNDTGASSTNPIDQTPFFVRQHYLDFLAREPETCGLNAWINVIDNCAMGDEACDRVKVSRSFFESPEFQSRGYFIVRVYQAAYKRNPLYGEFMGDLRGLSGATPEESNALREGFIANLMARGDFSVAGLIGISNLQYVDRLIANTGLAFSNRDALVASLDTAQKTRAQVLQEIVDSFQFVNDTLTFSRAYILAQYFGYLRRNPDTTGYNMWLDYLTAHPRDFRTMVNGFVNSNEYRSRFGTP